jgi:hypothetical protein
MLNPFVSVVVVRNQLLRGESPSSEESLRLLVVSLLLLLSLSGRTVVASGSESELSQWIGIRRNDSSVSWPEWKARVHLDSDFINNSSQPSSDLDLDLKERLSIRGKRGFFDDKEKEKQRMEEAYDKSFR